MDEIIRVIEGVVVTPLNQIEKLEGCISHAIKVRESSFHGFGECYFSQIKFGHVKAWKTHSKMWLNLVVPVGSVKFVLIDKRKLSRTRGGVFEIVLNPNKNYCRLTIPPGITFGFKGLEDNINLVLNIASIEHDPKEVENMPKDSINYSW